MFNCNKKKHSNDQHVLSCTMRAWLEPKPYPHSKHLNLNNFPQLLNRDTIFNSLGHSQKWCSQTSVTTNKVIQRENNTNQTCRIVIKTKLGQVLGPLKQHKKNRPQRMNSPGKVLKWTFLDILVQFVLLIMFFGHMVLKDLK